MSTTTGIHLLKVKIGNTRTVCEFCLKLTIKPPDVVLVSLLLSLNRFTHCSGAFIVNFEPENIDWDH